MCASWDLLGSWCLRSSGLPLNARREYCVVLRVMHKIDGPLGAVNVNIGMHAAIETVLPFFASVVDGATETECPSAGLTQRERA